MTPLGNLFNAVATVLDIAINILVLLILVRVVLSWVMPQQQNAITQTVFAITEPFLFPIRNFMSKYTGTTMIDLSPIIAFLALTFLQIFLISTLRQMAVGIQF